MTDLETAVREKLLAAIDDLRAQAERGEIHTLAYAAVGRGGEQVLSSLSNPGLCPVTLLGAIQLLSHRVLESLTVAVVDTASADEPEPEKTN